MNTPLSPRLRRFVDRQVKRGRFKNADDVINVAVQQMALADDRARSAAQLAGMTGSEDIEALVFVVMMDAAKSAQEDLKAIMAEMKAMTAAKARLRELSSRVNRDVAANAGCDHSDRKLDFSRGLGREQAYHRAPMPVLDPDARNGVRLKSCDLHPGRIESYGDLVAIRDGLKDQIDSLSEMSEMVSLRLQIIVDRRARLMQTLSNIMKKMSSTADTLVQNLK
jgi:Arc/MetJ-type ribon-helix-helix transcriptional regulator